MVDFSEYLNFLEELEHTLQQLVDVEQKKSAAVLQSTGRPLGACQSGLSTNTAS